MSQYNLKTGDLLLFDYQKKGGLFSFFTSAIKYFTGSKYFNTAMRGYSLKLGYSLNEHAFKDIKTQQNLQKDFNLK